MSESSPPVALTIAGSDSGGGAGIQADLKTFAALGVFGTTAITSVTAQNTVEVRGVRDLPPDAVRAQIEAVMDDFAPRAVKSGMLSNAAIVGAVAEELARYRVTNYVLDPVMISETGHSLLQADAVAVIKELLIPLALVVTPNVHEAEALTGLNVSTEKHMLAAAGKLHDLGARYVLIKGGHLPGDEAIDVLSDGERVHRYSATRIDTRSTHGTGCTCAAAIAAYLAMGKNVPDAVEYSKAYVTGAIQHGLHLGAGSAPLNHFWRDRTDN